MLAWSGDFVYRDFGVYWADAALEGEAVALTAELCDVEEQVYAPMRQAAVAQ